jgi:hypothetical protein
LSYDGIVVGGVPAISKDWPSGPNDETGRENQLGAADGDAEIAFVAVRLADGNRGGRDGQAARGHPGIGPRPLPCVICPTQTSRNAMKCLTLSTGMAKRSTAPSKAPRRTYGIFVGI